MCPIMTTLFNRLFNSLYAFLPWKQNSQKRTRDDSSDENEENFEIGVTPSKKQKVQAAPFGQNILKEMNPPTVTTVKTAFKAPTMPKLQITEDFYEHRRKLSSKSSLPRNWGGVIYLDDSGKPPKHVSSPIKLRKRLMASTPIANIDLTKNDGPSTTAEFHPVPKIDLTNSSPPRHAPSNLPVRRLLPVVDLTESEKKDEMRSSKMTHTANYSKPTRFKSTRRKSLDRICRHKDKPVLSIDLTSQNGDRSPGRKKRASAADLTIASKPVEVTKSVVYQTITPKREIYPTLDPCRHALRAQTVIDLEGRNCYGRVLGSMLEGKLATSPPTKSPPSFKPGTLVDLTSDDDEVSAIEKSQTSMQSDLSTSVKYVTASPVIEIKDDSFLTGTLPKNGTKKPLARVNSFESKLKDVPFTHQEWVINLMKEYNETQKSFTETRDRFYREATAWSDENKRAIEELLEKKLEKHLKITEAIVTETPEEKYAPIILSIPKFSTQVEAKIKAALVRSPEHEVLIDKFNLKITRRDIQTLNGLNWLNDEVINFYMQLLEERAKTKENYPSIHTFSTFFYAGLQSRGHAGMKRWTKKVNIFEKQLVIIPIHLHMHWCLVVIDLMKKELNYYDSMGHDNNDCLRHMSNYLLAEHEVKQGSTMDLSDWKIQNIKNIPQQMNGSDCGIFACTYAEYCSRRAPFNFDQSRMQHYRRKMVYEIISGQLMS